MKKKVLFIIAILLTVNIINSQTQQLDRLLMYDFSDPFHDKTLAKERLDKINYTKNFDSTSVVDSLIVIKADGAKEKYLYTYDSNGDKIFHLFTKWDGSLWVNELKETYTYDSNRNMTSYLQENWDGGQWVNKLQRTYNYNADGNMTLEIRENWDGSNWVNEWRFKYTYHSDGYLTIRFSEHWYEDQWGTHSRQNYTYDNHGNMTLEIREDWDGTNWINDRQYKYTFDLHSNMTLFLWQNWDGTNWVNELKEVFTYDSNSNLTSYIWERWSLSVRWTYVYNSNWKMILELGEDWDGSQWVKTYQRTYTYDFNEKIIQELNERWIENQLINESRKTYTYDSNGNVVKGKSEKWDDNQWIKGQSSIKFYDSFGREYSFLCAEINIYYSTITDVKETHLYVTDYKLFQNYPNPFNPETVITYQLPVNSHVNLIVYDLLGCEIKTLVNKEQSIGIYKVKFNAKNLSSGVYLYRIEAGSFSDSKKLLLLK